MIIHNWLKNTSTTLSLDSGTAQLDAEVMLAHVLGVDRSWLHAHPEFDIPTNKLNILDGYQKRRAQHEPIAYILEKTEFYGREFYITNDVLVPRPESETIIDLCKRYCGKKKPGSTFLIDVGTGSGALIASAVLETKINNALAIDIDDKCLEVAKKNINKYGLEIDVEKGDLLEPVFSKDTEVKDLVILANLPYVPEQHSINQEASKEPAHAIFGGSDGLDLYRRMFEQLSKIHSKSVAIFAESLPYQHDDLKQIASNHDFEQTETADFIQVFVR